MGSSGPWFCGPMIPTKDKVVSFSSTVLIIMLFYSHCLRIVARLSRFTFNIQFRKRKGPEKQYNQRLSLYQKSEFFEGVQNGVVSWRPLRV